MSVTSTALTPARSRRATSYRRPLAAAATALTLATAYAPAVHAQEAPVAADASTAAPTTTEAGRWAAAANPSTVPTSTVPTSTVPTSTVPTATTPDPYPLPAKPMTVSGQAYPVKASAALAGTPLARTATPQPVSGPFSLLLDVFGADSAPDGGRVDALDYSIVLYLDASTASRSDGTCALVTVGTDGLAHPDTSGTVACSTNEYNQTTVTVHRTSPDSRLLLGMVPDVVKADTAVTAIPHAVSVSDGVEHTASGVDHFRQESTFALFDPSLTVLAPPAATTTYYPFAVDAKVVKNGSTTLGYTATRPIPVTGSFTELVDVSGQMATSKGTTTVSPLDYTLRIHLSAGLHHDGTCTMARYYAGESRLVEYTDAKVTCTTSGQDLVVKVSTNDTLNDLLLGFKADPVTATTVVPPIAYDLDVTRASYFPVYDGTDPQAGLAPISGRADIGVAIVRPGGPGVTPTTTVAPPSPTTQPTSWAPVPTQTAPKTTFWDVSPFGSMNQAFGSLSDQIQQGDPNTIPLPDLPTNIPGM